MGKRWSVPNSFHPCAACGSPAIARRLPASCLHLPDTCLHLSWPSEPQVSHYFLHPPQAAVWDRLEHSSYHLKAAPFSVWNHFQREKTSRNTRTRMPDHLGSKAALCALSSLNLAILDTPVLPLKQQETSSWPRATKQRLNNQPRQTS